MTFPARDSASVVSCMHVFTHLLTHSLSHSLTLTHSNNIYSPQLHIAYREHGVISAGVASEMVGQLGVRQLGSGLADHVPPGGGRDGSESDVQADGHVPPEQPGGDEGFLGSTRLLIHDVQVGGIEAQSGSRKTVSDQVDLERRDNIMLR